MDNIIKITIKHVYGKPLLYPSNYIKELEILTGKKTLDQRDLEALEGLGFKLQLDNSQTIADIINNMNK